MKTIVSLALAASIALAATAAISIAASVPAHADDYIESAAAALALNDACGSKVITDEQVGFLVLMGAAEEGMTADEASMMAAAKAFIIKQETPSAEDFCLIGRTILD